ncbi:MAG: DUF6946 family protein [Flavobacterium sp.]
MHKKIYIPTENADSWISFLASKDKQWKSGFSAMETALSWETAKGKMPKEIEQLFLEDSNFEDLELILALPEYKVDIPGGSSASQNDVLAIFRTKNALSVMTIEGKAKEDFDKKIINWKESRSDRGVQERLGFLIEKIGITTNEIDHLRYQLFHRLASAIIMAEKFHAKNAIMVIQSFEDDNKKNHFEDFQQFLACYNINSVEKSNLYKLNTGFENIAVYAGWVQSEKNDSSL